MGADNNGAETVQWDLSTIYDGPNDPAIGRDEAEIDRLVDSLQAYRGSLERRAENAEEVAAVLADLEKIRFLADRLVTFAALGAATNQDDSKHTTLHARIEERHSRWTAQIVFVELELRRLPAEMLGRLIESPKVKDYRHFLKYQASLAKHTLSEAEEQLALKKNIAGRDASVRFREEHAARLDFGTLMVNGEERPMTAPALMSLREHPDPEVRYKARHRLNEAFGSELPVFAFIYGSVVKDHGVDTELRSYSEPIEVENVPNEVPGEVVRNLITASHKYLPELHEFYRWKAEKLGIEKLRTCDQAAPMPGSEPESISWEFARSAVQDSFAKLGPSFSDHVGAFFDDRRLDAAVRKGKRGGAFCAPIPGMKPYVLMSYTGTLSALVTLAHELGHGIHFVLSGEEQSYLQAYNMSKVIAETASEFGECLLRDHLLETSDDDALKRRLVLSEVDRFIGVIYRQLFFTEFELAVHERAAKEPLPAETLCEIWEKLSIEHYGPHVEHLENDRFGWSIVGHFVFNPFYCYSYALSQVVVLALYRKWKTEGEAFLPRLLDLLRGGWSGTPVELLARAGMDLKDPAVMEDAFLEFKDRVKAAKEVCG